MTRALILSGAGRYADPWHPFAQTSACLAEILTGCGVSVTIATDVDAAMTLLDGVDLLVVNAGDPSRNDLPVPDLSAARAGFAAALERGIAVLGTHTAAASLTDYPEWESVLGGRWSPERSMHPPIGPARITLHADRHPVVAGLGDFDTVDERYSHLRVAADVVPLAAHTLDEVEHPLLWARTAGSSRVVYSALGHDARAYESAELRELLARATRWLTGR
ncbi:ThuA domain-containing protein [Cryobacterium lactosi]|uniref:ThuA domain-containing protein n=1 Tax=Cryobacterium lactosi TaxID=1259202 RepID=A0A4V3IXU6_9MICO|nr:ThuA domain-containing protein [Cryobacterium lactosi]TFD93313.1 ThuA domain-containing protein [Cryobacterium lactosi]